MPCVGSASGGDGVTPLASARQIVARVAWEQPRVTELASLAAFAVRVDSPLLRRLRMTLMPGSTPALEADLWLGELVTFRGPEGFVFAPGVASILRERLSRTPARYEEAWRLTRGVHAALAPMLLLEEELNYLQFSRAPDAYARARERLRAAVAAILQSDTPDLARWAAGAATRLPADLMDLEEGRMLVMAAQTRLPGSLMPLEVPPGIIPEWMSLFAWEGMERTKLGVKLFPGYLEFAPARGNEETVLEVPRTTPLVVEVADAPEGAAPTARRRRFFLSYARGDSAAEQAVAGALHAVGHETVVSMGSIPTGASWRDLTQESIDNADTAILLLSKHAFASKQLDEEVRYLFERKERDGGDFFLLPVYLEPSLRTAIVDRWPELASMHGLMVKPREELQQFAARIVAELEGSSDTAVTWRRLEIQPPFPLRIPIQAGQLRLRTLAGDEYIVEPREPAALLQLPPPREDLVGYERELDGTLKEIHRGAQAILIQGSEGAGKTQFALRVAAQVVSQFPGGALYIEERLGHPPLTARAIAQMVVRALTPGAASRQGDPLADYRDVTSKRRVLLVVDGLSRLGDEAGEEANEVFEALLPGAGSLLLFVARRLSSWPHFHQVKLEGLAPASAVALLSQLAPHIGEQVYDLADACGFLPGPLREIGRTLAQQQPDLPLSRYVAALRRSRLLSVFPDTFELHAAKEVLDRADELSRAPEQSPDATPEGVEQMARAGLVLATNAPGRFTLWWPVRQIAGSVPELPGHQAMAWAHANYFADVLERLNEQYRFGGVARARAIEQFELEWPNIAAAHGWAEAQLDQSIELTGMARWFPLAAQPLMELLRPPRERMRWHERIRAADNQMDDTLVSRLTRSEFVSIRFAYAVAQADAGELYAAMETCFSTRARTALERQDPWFGLLTAELARLHVARGEWESAREEGRLHVARDDWEAAREEAERLGSDPVWHEPRFRALSRWVFAMLALREGRLAQAEQEFQAAREAAAEAADVRLEVDALMGIASIAAEQHNLGRAAALYEETLDFARTWRDERGVALVSWELGLIRARQGNLERAREWMQCLVDYRRAIGHEQAESTAERMEERLRLAASGNDRAPPTSTTSHRPMATLLGHNGPVYSGTFSPDGMLVLTASHDHTARLWDAASGKLRYVLRGHSDVVFSASFSPDGKQVLTASYDRTARLWDAVSGKTLAVLRGHDQRPSLAFFSPNGRYVLTAGEEHTVRIWAAPFDGPPRILGHARAVSVCTFSLDGKRLLTASQDGLLRIWMLPENRSETEIHLSQPAVAASFSLNSTHVFTASRDGSVRIWDLRKPSITKPIDLPEYLGPIDAATFSKDGERILTTDADGTVRVQHVHDPTVMVLALPHAQRVVATHFSPDERHVLTVSRDGRARLWDAGSGKLWAEFDGHSGPLHSAVFSPDGQRILTTGEDGTALIWDAHLVLSDSR